MVLIYVGMYKAVLLTPVSCDLAPPYFKRSPVQLPNNVFRNQGDCQVLKCTNEEVDDVSRFEYTGHRSSLARASGRLGLKDCCNLECNHLMSLFLKTLTYLTFNGPVCKIFAPDAASCIHGTVMWTS